MSGEKAKYFQYRQQLMEINSKKQVMLVELVNRQTT